MPMWSFLVESVMMSTTFWPGLGFGVETGRPGTRSARSHPASAPLPSSVAPATPAPVSLRNCLRLRDRADLDLTVREGTMPRPGLQAKVARRVNPSTGAGPWLLESAYEKRRSGRGRDAGRFLARPAHPVRHPRARALLALPARAVRLGRQELRAVGALRVRPLVLFRRHGGGLQGAGQAPAARDARRPRGLRDLPRGQHSRRKDPVSRHRQRRGRAAGSRLPRRLGGRVLRRRPPRPRHPRPQRGRTPPHAPHVRRSASQIAPSANSYELLEFFWDSPRPSPVLRLLPPQELRADSSNGPVCRA